MATRGRKSASVPKVSGLLDALAFVSCAQKPAGTAQQTHCQIGQGFVIAFDGVLAAGAPMGEPLACCPHTATLMAALAACGDAPAVTVRDDSRLTVASGKFRATVATLDPQTLHHAAPDPALAPVDDRLRQGFEAVAGLATEGATTVAAASVLLEANTVSATNRAVLMQYWHGIDLPPNLLLPKASVDAILKIGKPLTQFGYSDSSVTFYFEGGYWLKTQLYNDKFPNVVRVLDAESVQVAIPPELFDAVKTVSKFCAPDKPYVFVGPKGVSSDKNFTEGATVEFDGFSTLAGFNFKLLLMLAPVAKTIALDPAGKCLFFGDNLRGAIMPVVLDN